MAGTILSVMFTRRFIPPSMTATTMATTTTQVIIRETPTGARLSAMAPLCTPPMVHRVSRDMNVKQ